MTIEVEDDGEQLRVSVKEVLDGRVVGRRKKQEQNQTKRKKKKKRKKKGKLVKGRVGGGWRGEEGEREGMKRGEDEGERGMKEGEGGEEKRNIRRRGRRSLTSPFSSGTAMGKPLELNIAPSIVDGYFCRVSTMVSNLFPPTFNTTLPFFLPA